MSAILVFDYNLFILQFPQFSNPVIYPQVLLQNYWDIAVNYISDIGNCGWLVGAQRQYAINLMLAHLIYLNDLIAKNQNSSLVQSATVDKVSVSTVKPPESNQWQWWLNNSPYGQQLLALLQVSSVGGFGVGGAPVMSGFRMATFGRGYSCGGCGGCGGCA